ncbi:heterokaryon incompatibility protein-domain-containing protein [Annulohypoxylon bovei var. microspora]|nr:heterokaryon incompatibility protein-domain-containing protein [Annulohypoxylon bovei var. microspora]
MRLLNTKTYQLTEFAGTRPQYAILSHRWEEEEVSFRDIQEPAASSRKGYEKIKKCCRRAFRDGCKWVWIDTCCIDKSSSAELSEAINSMYRWYAESDVCYAYLSDVEAVNAEIVEPDLVKPYWSEPNSTGIAADHVSQFEQQFSDSKWFTRGWTLQELLAPRRVEFYNKSWVQLGTKASLKKKVAHITGIDEDVLLGYTTLHSLNVALKMSWASHRTTRRVEDTAYCLLGILNVNMPLIYGEGDRAFKRLQEELIRQYEDYTILISTSGQFLAESPANFKNMLKVNVGDPRLEEPSIDLDLRKLTDQAILPFEEQYEYKAVFLTNRGLHTSLLCQHRRADYFLAWTRCKYYDSRHGPLLIFMGIFIGPNDRCQRYPHLYYFKQDYVEGQMNLEFGWREVYLQTWDGWTPIKGEAVTLTLLCSHASKKALPAPIDVELWHSESFTDKRPGSPRKEDAILQLAMYDAHGQRSTQAFKHPLAIVLVLPQQLKNRYIFLIGFVDPVWSIVFHGVANQAVDLDYLRTINLRLGEENILRPEIAMRLVDDIKVSVSGTEMLSVSLKYHNLNSIIIRASLDKRKGVN